MTRNEQRTRPAKYKWVLAMLGRSQDYSKPLSKQLSRATLLVAVSSRTPPLNNVNLTGSRHPLHRPVGHLFIPKDVRVVASSLRIRQQNSHTHAIWRQHNNQNQQTAHSVGRR